MSIKSISFGLIAIACLSAACGSDSTGGSGGSGGASSGGSAGSGTGGSGTGGSGGASTGGSGGASTGGSGGTSTGGSGGSTGGSAGSGTGGSGGASTGGAAGKGTGGSAGSGTGGAAGTGTGGSAGSGAGGAAGTGTGGSAGSGTGGAAGSGGSNPSDAGSADAGTPGCGGGTALTGKLNGVTILPTMCSQMITYSGETIIYLSSGMLTCAQMQTSRWLGSAVANSQVIEVIIKGDPVVGTNYPVPPGEVNYALGGKSSATEVTATSGQIAYTLVDLHKTVEGTVNATSTDGSTIAGTFHAVYCTNGQEY